MLVGSDASGLAHFCSWNLDEILHQIGGERSLLSSKEDWVTLCLLIPKRQADFCGLSFPNLLEWLPGTKIFFLSTPGDRFL
jgi:hypothetical protein